jgi:hypothetical protein
LHSQIETHTIWGLFASIPVSLNRCCNLTDSTSSVFGHTPPVLPTLHFARICLTVHLIFSYHSILFFCWHQSLLLSFESIPTVTLKVKNPWIFYHQWYESFSDGVNIQSPCLISKPWLQTYEYLRNAVVWSAGNEVWFFQCLFLWLHMQKIANFS